MAFKKDTDWVGVDLDGTLAHHEPGDYNKKGALVFGEPIKPAVKLVKALITAGIKVKIVTARFETLVPNNYKDNPRLHEQNQKLQKAISQWTEKHLGKPLEVTNAKDGYMHVLIDDRACAIESNTGRLLGGLDRLRQLIDLDSILDSNDGSPSDIFTGDLLLVTPADKAWRGNLTEGTKIIPELKNEYVLDAMDFVPAGMVPEESQCVEIKPDSPLKTFADRYSIPINTVTTAELDAIVKEHVATKKGNICINTENSLPEQSWEGLRSVIAPMLQELVDTGKVDPKAVLRVVDEKGETVGDITGDTLNKLVESMPGPGVNEILENCEKIKQQVIESLGATVGKSSPEMDNADTVPSDLEVNGQAQESMSPSVPSVDGDMQDTTEEELTTPVNAQSALYQGMIDGHDDWSAAVTHGEVIAVGGGSCGMTTASTRAGIKPEMLAMSSGTGQSDARTAYENLGGNTWQKRSIHIEAIRAQKLVDAFLWDATDSHSSEWLSLPSWVHDAVNKEILKIRIHDASNREASLGCKTVSGFIANIPLDNWIIKGAKEDDIYPCDPEVFKASYDPAPTVTKTEWNENMTAKQDDAEQGY